MIRIKGKEVLHNPSARPLLELNSKFLFQLFAFIFPDTHTDTNT